MNARLLILPLALALFGCTSQAKKPEAQGPQPYKFPHGIHVESDVACVECHAPILKTTSVKENAIDVALPKKSEVCSACHDPIPDYKPVQRFAPAVRFDHAGHLPRLKAAKNECQACHTKFTEPGTVEAPVPAMATCTACHNHAQDFAVGRCTPCHRDLRKYEKPAKAYTHEASFLETHGKWAKQSVTTCSSCHDQTMCSQCHTATTRPMPPSVQFPEKVASQFIHRGDWIARHAMEQAADPTSCSKCHGAGYCQSCHEFQGVVGTLSSTGRDPHSAGWITFHGSVARQNILSCAGCHNQGASSKCMECHSAKGSGFKVNPHPPGWKGTASQATSNPTCKICH
jgi:hypothetical protein